MKWLVLGGAVLGVVLAYRFRRPLGTQHTMSDTWRKAQERKDERVGWDGVSWTRPVDEETRQAFGRIGQGRGGALCGRS